MTPNELRKQADSLLQRGLFRRAANVLQLITTHRDATEAERDRAQDDAARIVSRHCRLTEEAEREKRNRALQIRRAAAKEKAAKPTGKPGDGLRAAQQQIREAQQRQQQWKEQKWTA